MGIMPPIKSRTARGVERTSGHLSSNGGLRGHSVGELFPCSIYLQGTYDALKYRVKFPDGSSSDKFETYEEAHICAVEYLQERGESNEEIE